MSTATSSPGRSKLTRVELSALPRKPHGCPSEVERSWARFRATHESVARLFATLNESRAAKSDARGAISELHLDQVRAAIVFTAAGIDACLRTLLRDALEPLLREDGPAHGAFKRHFIGNRLKRELTSATKKAVLDIDPRSALIELYVEDLTGSSIQGWKDLSRCRDALGIRGPRLEDAVFETHQDFFNARHKVVHELDLVDPSGKGSRGRQPRDLTAVGQQCDRALLVLHDFMEPTAKAVKAVQRSKGTGSNN